MNKVIVVGNGPSILRKENGKLIDSFEIVVRFNWYHINKYEKYTGVRTDFWFTTVADADRMRKTYKRVYEHGWQWDPLKDHNYMNLLSGGFSPIKTKKEDLIEMQQYVGYDDYWLYSTGAIAIWILLREFEQLTITGFDWWEKNWTKDSKHHYGDSQKIGNNHKPDKEYRFISKLLNEKKVIFL